MNGKITFETPGKMAEFLKEFTGSTAVFNAYEIADGCWVIEFTGGH